MPQPSWRSEQPELVLRQRPQGNPNRCCASTRIVPRPTAGKPCRSHHCAQRLARALLRHKPETPASRRLRLAKQRARQQTASSRTSRPRHSDEWESALIAEGRIIITDVFDLISHRHEAGRTPTAVLRHFFPPRPGSLARADCERASRLPCQK